jgi:uncharacterized phage protein gp47/JayE
VALNDSGYTPKTAAAILADFDAAWVTGLGFSLYDDPVSEALASIVALSLAQSYSLIAAAYDGLDPNNASGFQLDRLAAIFGLVREPATYAQGTLTVTGTAGTLLPSGRRLSTGGIAFSTLAAVTIPVSGSTTVSARAEVAGALTVAASSTWTILTPVTGWIAATNAAAFTPGADAEEDSALLDRMRQASLPGGGSTVQALYTALAALASVQKVRVRDNRTLTTDAYGLPAKSILALIHPDTLTDAEKQEVATVIWQTVPAGIESDGDEEAEVTDSQGYTQTIRWTFAQEVAIYATVEYTPGADFPEDGEDQISDAITAYLASLNIGDKVVFNQILAAIFTVAGVEDATLTTGTAPSPVGTTNIILDFDQIAAAGTITVTEA